MGLSKNSQSIKIKKAYYEKAKKYYKATSSNEKAKFEKYSKAYYILINPHIRLIFDKNAFVPEEEMKNFDLSTIWNDFISEGLAPHFDDVTRSLELALPNTLIIPLKVSFLESVLGVQRDFKIELDRHCPSCDGTGSQSKTQPTKCINCHGHGLAYVNQTNSQPFTCANCFGLGYVVEDQCTNCSGIGILKQSVDLSVQIPAGVTDDYQIELKNMGNFGPRLIGKGDLVFNITVEPHPIFKRNKNNIEIDIPINLTQACLGDSVTVPTIYGDVTFDFPSSIQTGDYFLLKGYGIDNSKELGDQICSFIVESPKILTDDQKNIIKKIKLIDEEQNSNKK